MKRWPSAHGAVALLSIVTAVAAAPAALAGDILKCVDGGGHVTLTDQPCAAGSAAYRLGGDAAASEQQLEPQRHIVPASELRAPAWRRQAARAATPAPAARLAGDVATLKAARRTLLMQDAKPRLAGLD